MKRLALLLAILAVPTIMLISCSKNSPTAPSLAPDQGKMMFALDAADNIATGQVTITKGALTHVLPITITDHSGTVTFAGIQVGHWDILVQLFDEGGVEIYTGTGEAIVTKDATTTVTIRVEHNTGTLIINVEVPGLVLWNKLGSDIEVQNSEEGLNLSISGTPIYEPAQHGNGVYFNSETEYLATDSSVLPKKRGCVEYWWKPDYDYDVVNSQYNCRFWGSSGGYVGINYSKLRVGGFYSYNVTTFTLQYSLQDNAGARSIVINVPPQPFQADDLVHLAFVWDVDGQIEGQYTLAIYQNGARIGAGTQDISADMELEWDSPNMRICNFDGDTTMGWDGVKGSMDNLKIWNYPKTDFSDRFVE